MPYPTALSWMHALTAARRSGARGDTVLFLEHPPVLTIGRGCGRDDIVADAAALNRAGLQVHDTDRGGRVTYHGPGQLVCYPILWIGRSPVHAAAYARTLGQVVVALCRRLGHDARWDEAAPGVWVGGKKVGAVGVRVEGGVSSHGFALNVSPELGHYRFIVPCGLSAASIGSLHSLGGPVAPLPELAAMAAELLARALPPRAASSASDLSP